MCLNETYSKVRIGKNLSDSFPIQNGLKQGDALWRNIPSSPFLRMETGPLSKMFHLVVF
jgi:hypothetical protein